MANTPAPTQEMTADEANSLLQAIKELFEKFFAKLQRKTLEQYRQDRDDKKADKIAEKMMKNYAVAEMINQIEEAIEELGKIEYTNKPSKALQSLLLETKQQLETTVDKVDNDEIADDEILNTINGVAGIVDKSKEESSILTAEEAQKRFKEVIGQPDEIFVYKETQNGFTATNTVTETTYEVRKENNNILIEATIPTNEGTFNRSTVAKITKNKEDKIFISSSTNGSISEELNRLTRSMQFKTFLASHGILQDLKQTIKLGNQRSALVKKNTVAYDKVLNTAKNILNDINDPARNRAKLKTTVSVRDTSEGTYIEIPISNGSVFVSFAEDGHKTGLSFFNTTNKKTYELLDDNMKLKEEFRSNREIYFLAESASNQFYVNDKENTREYVKENIRNKKLKIERET